MDGASRALGTPRPLVLGGKTVNAHGLQIGNYAEVEAQVLASRPNPFLIAKQNLLVFAGDEDAKRILMDTAMRQAREIGNRASRSEVAAWLSSLDGFMFGVWLSVRENGPEYTREHVRKLLTDEMDSLISSGQPDAWRKRQEEIQDTIDAASGGDDMGNSTGPAST